MNLPDSFTQYTRRLMGDALYSRFLEGLAAEPPVSIRLNPLKTGGVKPQALAAAAAVPWCDGGLYLPSRPNFTFDPMLHAGHYYVQEASSMFVHHVLRSLVSAPVCMLDMCAAPGGKSTAALAALPAGSVLMANEPMRPRANILVENIQKWGSPNVIVTNNYPHDYAAAGIAFDVILCDVPCSGEGMFRKDEDAVAEWSPQNVESCSRLQREIAAEAWQCLRPGGLLIYSTCTFNANENENNVRWMVDELGAEPVAVPVSDGWGVCGSLLDGFTAPVYRFIPGYTCGEGLFMAVVRKPDDAPAPSSRSRNKGKRGKSAVAPALPREFEQALDGWVSLPEASLRIMGDTAVALPPQLVPLYDAAASSLRILSAGVPLCTRKGRDVVPCHALALSAALRSDAFPAVEVTYEQAISYLRRDAITLPSDAPRGFVLVTWRGAVLGFAKNIGNRANNMYPQEWKIKSTHVPDCEPSVVVL